MSTLVLDTLEDRVSSDQVAVSRLMFPWEKISEQTASTDSAIDFTGLSGYDEYEVMLDRVLPTTDNTGLLMQFYQSSSLVTSSNYKYHGAVGLASADAYAGISNAGVGSTTGFTVTANQGNVSTEGLTGRVIVPYAQASAYPVALWQGVFTNLTPVIKITNGAGKLVVSGAPDGIRFVYISGNVASGTFTLFGRKYS